MVGEEYQEINCILRRHEEIGQDINNSILVLTVKMVKIEKVCNTHNASVTNILLSFRGTL